MRITLKLEHLLKNTPDFALKRRAKTIIEELELKNDDKIIEIGCGDGYYLHLLSNLRPKLHLIGVDIDNNALISAKANLRGKKVKLLQADLMIGLPFASSTFDKVIMSEVLEHLPNDLKGLKEARRLLKKDGILILTVPNANYPFLWDPVNWILERLFNSHIKSGFWAGIWNQHLRLYKSTQFQKLIKKGGLKIERIFSVTFWSLPFNHYIANLGARILASKKGPKTLTQGANKFSISSKKSLPVRIFFTLTSLVDSLNDFWTPKQSGVSIFARVRK